MQNVNSGRCAVVGRVKLNTYSTENHCIHKNHLYMIVDCLVKFCENIHQAICSALYPLVMVAVTICLVRKMQGVWPYKWCGLDVKCGTDARHHSKQKYILYSWRFQPRRRTETQQFFKDFQIGNLGN